MTTHKIPGLPGLSVSIPSVDYELYHPDNISGRHDEARAATVYPPASSGHRAPPQRVQLRHRVQRVITAATGEQLDDAMRRQTQIVADDQDDPHAYHAAKDLARNLAASEYVDRASAREQLGQGAFIPSAGSRLPWLFGARG